MLENLRFHIEEEGKGVDSEGNKVILCSDESDALLGHASLTDTVKMVLKNKIAIGRIAIGPEVFAGWRSTPWFWKPS